jgi:hypothetical protein
MASGRQLCARTPWPGRSIPSQPLPRRPKRFCSARLHEQRDPLKCIVQPAQRFRERWRTPYPLVISRYRNSTSPSNVKRPHGKVATRPDAARANTLKNILSFKPKWMTRAVRAILNMRLTPPDRSRSNRWSSSYERSLFRTIRPLSALLCRDQRFHSMLVQDNAGRSIERPGQGLEDFSCVGKVDLPPLRDA